MAQINVISHRGANIYAPQNTLPAFRRSMEIGVDGFETDVHLTRDGKPVLCHNYTIDKTSNGKGSISQMTLSELKTYDFGTYFSPKFADTRIPTLQEYLETVGTYEKLRVLNIELKSPRANESSLVADTINMVKEYGLFDKLVLSSFDPKLLSQAKQVDPQTKTGFLYSPTSKVQFRIYRNPLEVAKSLCADALHPMLMYVNADLVKKAHAAGMMVNVWTVNSPRSILHMAELGVDGLITDYPDVVKGVLEAHNYR